MKKYKYSRLNESQQNALFKDKFGYLKSLQIGCNDRRIDRTLREVIILLDSCKWYADFIAPEYVDFSPFTIKELAALYEMYLLNVNVIDLGYNVERTYRSLYIAFHIITEIRNRSFFERFRYFWLEC